MEFTCSLGRNKLVSDIKSKGKKLLVEIFCKSNKKN